MTSVKNASVVVFANVLFEEFGNQSVRNFVEGMLNHHDVLLVTVAHPTIYMHAYEARNPRLRIVYVLAHSNHGIENQLNSCSSGLKRRVKDFCKQRFAYRRYASNSRVWQWMSVGNTLTTLRAVHRWILDNRRLLAACECWVFIDVFGGLLVQYLRLVDQPLWRFVAKCTVGYYLGTVLTQFRGNPWLALTVMPLSFLGSYRVAHERLIITDDGTDGQNVFRRWLRYKNPILFIRNGVDERLLAVNKPEHSPDPGVIRFVACSRLTHWKRLDRVIQFAASVKAMATQAVRLTIIGEGEERTRLESLVRQTGMDRHTTFTGGLEYDRALDEIARHDYYLIFNDLSNLGNQVNESIVLGVVPLTMDDRSTDSLLTHDINCLKFPPIAYFEEQAARLFLKHHWAGCHARLQAQLVETKAKLFSWRERNRIEQDFIWGRDCECVSAQ